MNYQQSKLQINTNKTFSSPLSQLCSKYYCSCLHLFSASIATITLKQEKKKLRLQFCYFFLMVDIFQSVYGLSHFPTSVLENPIFPSICNRCFCLSSNHHTQPISQIQKFKDDCLSQVSLLYFCHIVGLGRKGSTHS